jgi:dihydroceramidase
VAEVSNTFSNVFFIIICLFGVHFSRKESLPTRVIVGFVVRPLRSSPLPVDAQTSSLLRFQGCGLVGLGSFWFHATLLYEAQLADELPMIYVTSFLLAMLLETEPGFGFPTTYSKTLVAATVVFNIVFTAT